MGVAVTS